MKAVESSQVVSHLFRQGWWGEVDGLISDDALTMGYLHYLSVLISATMALSIVANSSTSREDSDTTYCRSG